jgi:hypothetical protein
VKKHLKEKTKEGSVERSREVINIQTQTDRFRKRTFKQT